ncbi:MAG TPA: NYN domain-containing protein [Thermoleophilaceae bacterium]|nr:NYN domain-containing protein [Thermoleophilaceae bacterium]
MRLIVDGMNVIGSRPDGWWRDRRGAMESLVGRLGALPETDGEGVTVVFDGRPFKVAAPDGVEVLFASRRGRDAADDEIVRLVERSEEPSGLSVVTSDEDLAGRVRALGAEVVGAGAFRQRLDEP